jgi:hypothetical protein
MQPRRPVLLAGLTLTETLVRGKGANRHAEVLFWKSDLVKAIGAPAAARAAAEAVIARRDMPRATELLRDPDTYHAYYARAAGEEWRPPVASRRTSRREREALTEDGGGSCPSPASRRGDPAHPAVAEYVRPGPVRLVAGRRVPRGDGAA